jgi:hypothetical protein
MDTGEGTLTGVDIPQVVGQLTTGRLVGSTTAVVLVSGGRMVVEVR